MPSTRPYLLITNDDGIHAPGIKHLWQAVHEFADVIIVAPQTERSGAGLSITWNKPLVIHEVPWEGNTPAYTVNGTPADCVKMAISVVLKKRPHMIISGVNRGSNAGRTVLYSGTIGGCIEGALKHIPGIAFSFCDLDAPPLEMTKPYIYPLIRHFLEHPLPPGSLLNVNFPHNSKETIRGLKLARQGMGQWAESPDRRTHPEGMPYYWLGGKWTPHEQENAESDVYWLEKGYIAAVPLHVGELTDHQVISKNKSLVEQHFNEFPTSEGPRSVHSR
ncbi:MAG: 5'/3'-nucleotidase SurE [Verrucomicrobiota bacterium]|nr:5'/3'-nucleotidase SurE [Verrucomicrobiota bacterium]